jgi:hypothetical protein
MLVELIAFNFFVKNGCQWKKNNLKEIECKTDVPCCHFDRFLFSYSSCILLFLLRPSGLVWTDAFIFLLSRLSSSTTVLYLQLFSYAQVSSVQQFSKIY